MTTTCTSHAAALRGPGHGHQHRHSGDQGHQECGVPDGGQHSGDDGCRDERPPGMERVGAHLDEGERDDDDGDERCGDPRTAADHGQRGERDDRDRCELTEECSMH